MTQYYSTYNNDSIREGFISQTRLCLWHMDRHLISYPYHHKGTHSQGSKKEIMHLAVCFIMSASKPNCCPSQGAILPFFGFPLVKFGHHRTQARKKMGVEGDFKIEVTEGSLKSKLIQIFLFLHANNTLTVHLQPRPRP